MIEINRNAQWFQSADGIVEFEKITTLDERTLFIQQFLKKKTKESGTYFYDYEKSDMERVSFHFALFLADAIYGSSFPYAKYPALLDATQNPFLAYWQDKGNYGKAGWRSFYNKISQILLEENKKIDQDGNGKFKQQLETKAAQLQVEDRLDQVLQMFPDTTVFDLDPILQPIQLKNMWLFGNKGV